MANINFLYRSKSKKDNGPITLRLMHKSEIDLFANTQFYSSKLFWFRKNGKQHPLPYGKDIKAKKEKEVLIRLESFILEQFNKDHNNGIVIDKSWLNYNIDVFFKRKKNEKEEKSLFVVDNIQTVIDEAPYRKNSKGGMGLSKSRINDYKSTKRLILEYQIEKNLKLIVKDIDIHFRTKFLKWMVEEKKYDISYGNRILSTLKSACINAKLNGIPTSLSLNKISEPTKNNEFVIYLNNEELEMIKKAHLIKESHINARKWIIIGCYTGQRGSTLINISPKNFSKRGRYYVIELKQIKGNKDVTIPILPEVKKIQEMGWPHKVSTQKLNKYIKEVCEISGIDYPTKGKKFNKKTKRTKVGVYPKFELIGTHTFRRSFASNFYGVIPTPLIMKMTGHSSERTFYNYIGKSSYDYAEQMMEFLEKNSNNEGFEPRLRILSNTTK